jgi:hypothetical protein
MSEDIREAFYVIAQLTLVLLFFTGVTVIILAGVYL